MSLIVSCFQTAFFLLYSDGKKGLVNNLYHFCSTYLQFLLVINWPLIGITQEYRAISSTFFNYVIHTNIQAFVAISGQLMTCKNCGSVEQKWHRLFTRPFFPSQYKRKKVVWQCETMSLI